jgi:hypothetical protein
VVIFLTPAIRECERLVWGFELLPPCRQPNLADVKFITPFYGKIYLNNFPNMRRNHARKWEVSVL